MGNLLCYSCAVELAILPALNRISEQQENPTQNNVAKIKHFLDYAATNITAIVQYKYSDVLILIDSDTSYLSETWKHSRTGGHYHLSSLPDNPTKPTNLPPQANATIHTEHRIMIHVVDSVAKAECGGLFHHGKASVPLRITLGELSFNQPRTLIKWIIPILKLLLPLLSDKKGPMQWICDFIG